MIEHGSHLATLIERRPTAIWWRAANLDPGALPVIGAVRA